MGNKKCEHNRERSKCKDCGGGSICEHNRLRSTCKDCGGSQICEHNRLRSTCKDCGGGSICEHNRRRSTCKDCGGSSICEHNRLRSTCKDCGGSSICEHGKNKNGCVECSIYKCEKCSLFKGYKTESGQLLCTYCNPNSQLSKRIRPELKVYQALGEYFFGTAHIGTYAPFRECEDNNHPDIVVLNKDTIAHVEVDENDCHSHKTESCEWSKLLKHIQSEMTLKPHVLFIRFNPEAFKIDGITHRKTFEYRMNLLINSILEFQNNPTDIRVEFLFYPEKERHIIEKPTILKWINELKY